MDSSLPSLPVVSTPSAGPVRSWRSELGGYALAVFLTMGLLLAGTRFDRSDFHAPFTYDFDALLILPFVKATVERGSHWRNERLGAPSIQELHDFPVVDHLHFGVIWLLGRLDSDPVVVFNLFHLLTYPLTTITAMIVLRRYGLSMPAAICGAILYAFQPYHYLRGQTHYFLAAYYIVPLTLMVALDITRGRLPFFRGSPTEGYRWALWSRDSLIAVLIGLATASAGAYYAFFGCAMLVIAGLYGWVAARTWRATVSAWGVIAVVIFGGVLNHLPTFPYQAENGHNARAHVRMAEDAERYGMRIIQLVFPVAQHNPVGLGDTVLYDPAAIRSKYQAPMFKELNETDWDPLGLVGAVGYLLLLALPLFPGKRSWPLGPLSALTLFATLLGTTGGFGAMFNYLISTQVRCYNRISIYIAFLALFASCWLIDRFFDSRRGFTRKLRWPVFMAIVLFGLWDQTNDQWFPDLRIPKTGYVAIDGHREKIANQYWEDAAFFERVESLLPENGMVFIYPYLEYPESHPYLEPGGTEKIESYEPVLGYLHTRSIRWSYGAMKGREWDTWMREVAGLLSTNPPNSPRFLERLVFAGFDGLLIDARPINRTRWHLLKSAIERDLGHGAFREFHAPRQLYYFDLTGYRKFLQGMYGLSGFDALARAERERLVVLWLKGFASYEPVGSENRVHWCSEHGQLIFVNRSDRTLTIDVQMKFKTAFKGPAKLAIRGGDFWSDDIDIDSEPLPYTRRLVIPPGRHKVAFRCTPEINVLPNDSRNDLYTVLDFKTLEVPSGP